jgi:hypothetical protein
MKKLTFYLLILSWPTLAQQTFYDVTAGDGNGVRFWQSDAYKIHMGIGTEYNYGPVTNYSIKMNMNNDPAKGWTWGTPGVAPIAALNTQGHFQVAGNVTTMGDLNVGNTSDATGRWLRSGLGTYSTYPLNLGGNYKSGFASAWDTDGVFFGLSDQGSNRKDAIIAWGDDNNDMLRFLFNNSELARLSPDGSLSLGSATFLSSVRFRAYESGSSSSTWRGRIVSSGDNASVVLGEWNGKASLAAHNPQLTGWSDLIVQESGGNVGIGTPSPSQKFTINGSILQNSENTAIGIDAQANARLGFVKKAGFYPMIASDATSAIIFAQSNQTGIHTNIAGATLTERMRIETNGNVGIGTSSPNEKLNVYNNTAATKILIGNPNTSSGGFTSLSMGTSADANGFSFMQSTKSSGTAFGDIVLNQYGGNVGIGTTSPNQKLTVNGTIYGKEVKVDLNVPGPDYVFEKDYKLPSLDEIKSYIDQHKHLPEVPSAKEMEQNGINVSEMNIILLKKVEELTLLLMKEKERNEDVQSELQNRIQQLENSNHEKK